VRFTVINLLDLGPVFQSPIKLTLIFDYVIKD